MRYDNAHLYIIVHVSVTQKFSDFYTLVKASQQTRDVKPMLVYCLPIVYDAGPTLSQH